ncbi:MAG: hypothetical protein OSB42_04955 [Planctomycetota bacterium]|nr:hypothetical protein [Planctomycetota bacterium]
MCLLLMGCADEGANSKQVDPVLDEQAPVVVIAPTLKVDPALEESLLRIAVLEDLLAQKDALLFSREMELLRFQGTLAGIKGAPDSDLAIQARGVTVDGNTAGGNTAEGDKGTEPAKPAPDHAQVRAEEMRATLQGLLEADGVHNYQILTLGRLEDGHAGPVVVRLVDARGRPAGLMAAERLRLEASRAGYTVTILLEEGYEEHGGVSLPFDGAAGVATRGRKPRGGVRRVTLPGVNPAPWIEALPELFGAEAQGGPPDDGLWDLIAVRQEFNRLLAADPSVGRWRLAGLGGLVAGVLRDVQLVELDGAGRPLRRLFADALSLEKGVDGGLRIELTDGVQMVGGARTPFLEGRFRLILPRAEPKAWEAAGLPGLVPRPTLLARDRGPDKNAPAGN